MPEDQNPQQQPQPQPPTQPNPQYQPQQPIAPNPQPVQPYAPQGSPYTMPSKQKSKTGLIIGIVAGVLVLLVTGGLLLAFALASAGKYADNQKTNTNTTSSREDNSASVPKNNAITATTLNGMNAVCDGSSILNSAAPARPYKVAAFYKSDGKNLWTNLSLEYGAEYAASFDGFEQTNIVACMVEDVSSRERVKACEFTSGGERVSVDYYATSYTINMYEARTGKKVRELGTVSAPATTCPMFATYDRNDPKLIASPDKGTVDARLGATYF